jgi:Protein of unknown function (DUF3565)
MDRRIVGFHQDEEHHWVADLECGHSQHVRHDPPWQIRTWVLAIESRNQRLGTTLSCHLCDSGLSESETGPPRGNEPLDPYADARMQGLCHDGAAELRRRPR